jgi:hypothetical protein
MSSLRETHQIEVNQPVALFLSSPARRRKATKFAVGAVALDVNSWKHALASLQAGVRKLL